MSRPDGSDSRQSPNDDPVRLSPPADPWLAEAPTSVHDEAPPPDTTPFPAPAPWHGPPPSEPPRRAIRWVVAILAVCALFIAGMLAIDPFDSGDGGGDALGVDPSTEATAAPTPTRNDPSPTRKAGAAAPATPAEAGSPEVVYEVTASGSHNTGSVAYTDQDGEIIRRGGIPLPWRVTFPVGAQRKPLVLIAQRKGGGDAGPVTCKITVNGKLLASTTATGKYAAPQCSGSG